MKYMVMVNQKYLVTVEANTNGGAEHKILDNVYYGIETCQAFSPEDMKTEFFKSCFEQCETISYSELFDKAEKYKILQDKKEVEKDRIAEYRKQVEDLEEALMIARGGIDNCDNNIKNLSHQISVIL